MSKTLEKAILYGLLTAIVFTALAHGAVEVWSAAIFELLIIVLTALWGLRAVLNKQLYLRIPRVVFPLGALLLWGLLQSVAYTDQSGQQHSLSLDVEATRQTTTILSILLLALLLGTSVLAHQRYLTKAPIFLAVYGFLFALFGLIQHFAWNGRFFWWRETVIDVVTSPFGPFVAHNHFAGYMELLLPIPMAMVILGVGKTETRIFYGFAAAVMGGAALASLSRGGFISLFAQIIFLAAITPFLIRGRLQTESQLRRRKTAKILSPMLAVLAITGAIGVSIYWIGLEPVLNRISQGKVVTTDANEESFFVSRGWIWRDTLTMIRANLVTGVGLGAYETAFPVYSQSDGSLQVSQAHNDYLQLVAETGIIGGVLLLWFLGIVFSQVWHGMRSRDSLSAALALGCGGSIIGIMVHSLFDFNLQLPSHALLLILLTAVLARVNVPMLAVSPIVEPERTEGALINTVPS